MLVVSFIIIGTILFLVAATILAALIILRIYNKLKRLTKSVTEVSDMMIMLDMADRAQMLTAGLDTDQEKCIAVTSWVAANISNRTGNLVSRETVYSAYAQRSGLCNMRSLILCEMLKCINIPAKRLYLFDFQSPSYSHVCVHAWYDNAYHYYDPTYGGCFLDGDNVMSIEQILANPKYAIDNMMVFKNTIDKSVIAKNKRAGDYSIGSYYNSEGTPITGSVINNYDRMSFIYTVDSLTDFTSFGYKYTDIHIIQKIDCRKLPLVISEVSKQRNTMDEILTDFSADISAYVSYSTDAGMGYPKTNWHFENCKEDSIYYIKYKFILSPPRAAKVNAIPYNSTIISGRVFKCRTHIRRRGEWTIEFKSDSSKCGILIDFNRLTTSHRVKIDSIEIGVSVK